jgi:predicted transcriptional regulator
MTMASTTVRVSEPTHRTLRELSEQLGESMQGILEHAIEDYRRKRVLEQANAGYAALRADPEAWKEELAERADWDATLADGLDDE